MHEALFCLGAAMAYGFTAWRPLDRPVNLFLCGFWMLAFAAILSILLLD